MKVNVNKKVLLRERKRHTARRVASARYAALSNGWGCTPVLPHHPDLAGYPPIPGMGCLPPSRPGWGTHPPQGWGTPHHPDLAGVPPHLRDGYPNTIKTWLGYSPTPGMGYPHHPDLAGVPPTPGMGYPLPTIQTWPGYPPPKC